jgi:hypothetical protein
MAGETLTVTRAATFTIVACAECGVEFGLPEEYVAKRRKDRASFYCPNQHSQWYPGKTEEVRRKEAEERARVAEVLAQQKQRELDGALRTIAKVKADAKATAQRVAKRVDAGVCLHCQRSFQNVARHMYRMHDVENGSEAVDKLAAKLTA